MEGQGMSSAYAWCEQGSTEGLHAAIERLYRVLPGWWFSVGNCHVSADATVGPDASGADSWLLKYKEFDDGIDGSLPHPATIHDALMRAIDLALEAKQARENEKPLSVEIAECIARDSSCAAGGLKDRVWAILPYVTPLLDELSAAREAAAWRPIETAPKNQMILCSVPWLPYPKILFWADYANDWRCPVNEDKHPYAPTHWMPLKAPAQIREN
jgi:hypothetical protein